MPTRAMNQSTRASGPFSGLFSSPILSYAPASTCAPRRAYNGRNRMRRAVHVARRAPQLEQDAHVPCGGLGRRVQGAARPRGALPCTTRARGAPTVDDRSGRGG